MKPPSSQILIFELNPINNLVCLLHVSINLNKQIRLFILSFHQRTYVVSFFNLDYSTPIYSLFWNLSCCWTSQETKKEKFKPGRSIEWLSPLPMQIFKANTSTVIKPHNQAHFTNAVITACWLNPELLFMKRVRSINPLNPFKLQQIWNCVTFVPFMDFGTVVQGCVWNQWSRVLERICSRLMNELPADLWSPSFSSFSAEQIVISVHCESHFQEAAVLLSASNAPSVSFCWAVYYCLIKDQFEGRGRCMTKHTRAFTLNKDYI